MRLLLVRHGQTPSNVLRLLDTRVPGPGLTELGEEQASALVEALAQERVDAVWASTAVRTQLTAGPLARARGLEVRVHDGLRELEAGDLEMSGEDGDVLAYLTTTFEWARGNLGAHLPGAQDGHTALARLDDGIAAVAASLPDGGTALAVSHGAAIRGWVAARTQVSADFASSRPLLNTGLVVVEGEPETGWTALAWAGEPLEGPDSPLWAAGPAAEPVRPAAFGG